MKMKRHEWRLINYSTEHMSLNANNGDNNMMLVECERIDLLSHKSHTFSSSSSSKLATTNRTHNTTWCRFYIPIKGFLVLGCVVLRPRYKKKNLESIEISHLTCKKKPASKKYIEINYFRRLICNDSLYTHNTAQNDDYYYCTFRLHHHHSWT